MIRREIDADLINRISNSGDVPLLLAGYGTDFDWTPVVRHAAVLSNGEDACMAFEQRGRREWECTAVFAPTCRGKRAIEVGREFKEYMFPRWADVVFGQVPLELRHAQWFYRQLGGYRVDFVDGRECVYRAKPGNVMLELRNHG